MKDIELIITSETRELILCARRSEALYAQLIGEHDKALCLFKRALGDGPSAGLKETYDAYTIGIADMLEELIRYNLVNSNFTRL